jgi:peptidoglycan/LPS O-acetylase OafA/YrhL
LALFLIVRGSALIVRFAHTVNPYLSGVRLAARGQSRSAVNRSSPAAPAAKTAVRDESPVSTGLSHPAYRPEIDGLRAVAVLSVLGFHAFPDTIRGGYAGVDIFFIISGFLISGILLGNLERGTFSLITFYARRVQRIFPALIVVLIACYAAGWFVMLASEYTQLGKHIAAGAAFISNLMLWRETGYFDTAAETKPLLHLWSLGVEEQFYIFWPLLLYAAWRLRLRALGVVAAILLASFALSVHEVRVDTAAAFYSPLARFWELLIGGTLAYLGLHRLAWLDALDTALARRLAPAGAESGAGAGAQSLAAGRRRLRDLQSIIGGALIVLALVLLERGTPFPGWWALPPTVGAALIIGAGGDAWLNRSVLAHRGMVAVGLISYPIYLWHWPLLSFAQIVEGTRPAPSIRAAALVASIVLAALTYWLVEKPLRFGRWKRFMPPLLFIAMIGVGVTGYETYAHDGFSFRAMAQHSEETRIADEDKVIRAQYALSPCTGDARIIGRARGASCAKSDVGAAPGGPVMVVWGDSHAAAWAPLFARLARERGQSIVVFSTLGCPPLLHVRRSDSLGTTICSELGLAEDVVASIANIHPKDVIIVARWSMYANGWYQDGTLRDATHFVTTSATEPATLATSRAALASEMGPTVDALLGASTGTVLLIKSPPVLKSGIGVGLLRRRDSFEPTAQENRAAEEFASRMIDGMAAKARVRIFDPTDYYCAQKCSAFYRGVAMYTDDNHISSQGAMQFAGPIAADLD